MSREYTSRVWVCPFYRRHERQKVECEGGGIAFSRKETFQEFTDFYCANLPGWTHCSIAAALQRQYEREDTA